MSVALLPDGRLASASEAGAIRVWELNGAALAGDCLASGSTAEAVRDWSLAEGARLTVLQCMRRTW